MTYTFLEGITRADVAFEAQGKTQEELIEQAGLALQSVQVELGTVKSVIKRKINITAPTIDNLLYKFLEELVFLKDTEQLVFCDIKANIRTDQKKEGTKKREELYLNCELSGEIINPDTQQLGTDIKAVTLHKYKVEKIEEKTSAGTNMNWKATVVLDI
ncbi:MAG: archease [Candidatus Woesearchaeota archaeon]|nr:archease [Candidatus Woesearchaeota archaeon]